MVTRKTLQQAKIAKGCLDAAKFDSLGDSDIERSMAEDPDLAPATETLQPLLEVREVRRKLGLTQHQLAKKLAVPIAQLRQWEREPDRADPALQALLRILVHIPEPVLRALDAPGGRPDASNRAAP